MQVSEEACSDLEDQLKDPNYVAGTPPASENEEEEVEGSPVNKGIKRKMIPPVSPIKTKKGQPRDSDGKQKENKSHSRKSRKREKEIPSPKGGMPRAP